MARPGSVLGLDGPPEPVVESAQPALLVVSDSQLRQMVRPPVSRQLERRDVWPDRHARSRRVARPAWAAVFVLLAGGGAVWLSAPLPILGSIMPPWGSAVVPVLNTGASFSLAIAAHESRDEAGRTAARVRGEGFPAFTRRSAGVPPVYQAMVGPYASLEEARRAQERLGAVGFVSARLFVDETLRASAAAPLAAPPEGRPGVRLLGASDRLSLVFDMPSDLRRVHSHRTTESTYDIDLGPLPATARAQSWAAPDGVHLVERVSLAGVVESDGTEHLHASVELPDFARTSLRAEGRLVYLDLSWSSTDDDVVFARADWPSAPAPLVSRPRELMPVSTAPLEAEAVAGLPSGEAAPNDDLVADEERYLEAIATVHHRLAEIRPFLLSAVQSGEPQVLAALDQTLVAVWTMADAIGAPPSAHEQHRLLTSAIGLAREGLDPTFVGDRVAHAHQALTMIDGAAAPAVTPLAP